jgi:hypothetical protein
LRPIGPPAGCAATMLIVVAPPVTTTTGRTTEASTDIRGPTPVRQPAFRGRDGPKIGMLSPRCPPVPVIAIVTGTVESGALATTSPRSALRTEERAIDGDDVSRSSLRSTTDSAMSTSRPGRG